MPVQRFCEECGKEFHARPSLVARGKARFCSRACAAVGPPLADRFWVNVEMSSDPDACWLWTGTRIKEDSYGKIGFRGDELLAHRVAYEVVGGATPVPAPSMTCWMRRRKPPSRMRSRGRTMRRRTRRGSTKYIWHYWIVQAMWVAKQYREGHHDDQNNGEPR